VSNPCLAAATERGEITNLFEEHTNRLLSAVGARVRTPPVNAEDACGSRGCGSSAPDLSRGSRSRGSAPPRSARQ
jgi:hypothetical protein